jgi:hypothetical protein
LLRVGFCSLGCIDSLPRPAAAAGGHVNDPAPQERGGGAKGVPEKRGRPSRKRLQATPATQCNEGHTAP